MGSHSAPKHVKRRKPGPAKVAWLSREAEPVEFRPIAGGEQKWARYTEPKRSALWVWLGSYALIAAISWCLVCVGSTFLV